jgi:hypothetical protein
MAGKISESKALIQECRKIRGLRNLIAEGYFCLVLSINPFSLVKLLNEI